MPGRHEDLALIDQLRADVAAAADGALKPGGKRVYETWQAWVDDWLSDDVR